MLVLEIALDVVMMIFVLAFLPLFLGDLMLFAEPASSIGFIIFAGAFVAVLSLIDHATDESFWLALSDTRQRVVSAWKQHDWAWPALFLRLRAG